MTSLDTILRPRPVEQGISLRHAYRPRTSDDLVRALARHVCRACGRGTQGGHRWSSTPQSHQLGPVIYCTLEHTCTCGLSMTVFVVLNDILRSGEGHGCEPAEVALSRVEQHLPPESLERGLTRVRCMLHRGDGAEAVPLAEALVERFPQCPECHFNAGCARQNIGDAEEALGHYRRSLALHPQLAVAWLNRGLLLQQLGRLEEARFCLMRSRLSRGEPNASSSPPQLLCETVGMFDMIRVLEDEDTRALFIGSQCQGAMYRVVDDDGPEPGPFAYSPFTTGWLLAGVRHPRGRGLMLGLGSGAGAMVLLSCFPELRLRVVELDEHLIDIAKRYFPRLAQFERAGRLELVHGDACDLDPASRYDFVLLDLFDGTQDQSSILEAPGLLVALGCADTVLANTIFTLGSDEQRRWLEAFEAAGRPVVRLYPTGAPEAWSIRQSNWILSTVPIEPPAGFSPFAWSSHYLAEAARNDFQAMCDRGFAPAELRS